MFELRWWAADQLVPRTLPVAPYTTAQEYRFLGEVGPRLLADGHPEEPVEVSLGVLRLPLLLPLTPVPALALRV